MKNTFTLILLLITQISAAQIKVGVQIGPSVSKYHVPTNFSDRPITGVAIGAKMLKQIDDRITVNLDFLYIQKGYNHKICNTISDRLRTNFLELPVMVQYAVLATSNFQIQAGFGAYVAYWINGRYKLKGFEEKEEKFDFQSTSSKRLDFGPTGALGFEYFLNDDSSLSLNARYGLGLIDLQNENDKTKNRNRTWTIGISYLKKIKRN